MMQMGYSSVPATNRAINKAFRKHNPPEKYTLPEQVRDETDAGNAFLRQRLLSIIECPPGKQSAIGKLTADPDTCNCPQRLNPRMEDHDPDCTVQPVRDESLRIRAIDTYRKLDADRVKMHGASRKEIKESEAMQQMTTWLAEQTRRWEIAERAERMGLLPPVITVELDQDDPGDGTYHD